MLSLMHCIKLKDIIKLYPTRTFFNDNLTNALSSPIIMERLEPMSYEYYLKDSVYQKKGYLIKDGFVSEKLYEFVKITSEFEKFVYSLEARFPLGRKTGVASSWDF